MVMDVTVFINNLVANNPNISANVRKGASTVTALFSAAQGDGVNISTLLNSDSLPANVKSNISSFVGGINTLQSGGIPNITGIPSIPGLPNLPGSVSTAQQANKVKTNFGPDGAIKETFNKGANRILLDDPEAPIGSATLKVNDSVPILLQSDVRAIMVQIAYMETNYDKTYYEGKRIGRYAIDERTLINYGYMFNSNSQYTGKDGIQGQSDFMFDNNVQDRIMERFIQDQYKACIKSGAIHAYDTKANVAGIIAVSYQFQDATPSLTDATSMMSGISSGNLLDSLGKLTSGSDSILGAASASLGKSTSVGVSQNTLSAATTSITNLTSSSGIFTNLSTLGPQVASASIQGDKAAAQAAIDSSGLTAKATALATAIKADPLIANLANDFKSSAPSTLTSFKDQAQIAAAKVDLKVLTSAASDFASSIPANKTKSWRESGKEKDSQGRPGSLFFNAGRYAVSILAADIEA
jgi:hypothetical protein